MFYADSAITFIIFNLMIDPADSDDSIQFRLSPELLLASGSLAVK